MSCRTRRALVLACFIVVLARSDAHAQPLSLMTPKEAWSFNNGAEFPGATGKLTITTEEGREVLKLAGDFTKGGNYVQAGRNIDGVDIRELALWVRNPDADRFRDLDQRQLQVLWKNKGRQDAFVPAPPAAKVPGIVITHSPAASGKYIGSPSIAILADGTYLATHDQFGPNSTEHTSAVTRVFRSTDRGQTWTHRSDIQGAFWSTLFEHRGAVYLLGTTSHHGNAVIRRSTDGGATWTSPTDKDSGLLRVGQYHCAPVPIVLHGGRLWRAMEDASNGKKWGQRYQAMMMSAPADADLLKAASWTCSNVLPRNPQWLNGTFNAWLEGNAVVAPDNHVVNILRVDTPGGSGTATLVRISADGTTATFDSKADFLDFPGGATKFGIRRDPKDGAYWSLSNYIPPRHRGGRPAAIRNTLALIHSTNLRDWDVRSIVLYHPDPLKHGFQYVDWLFDGDDILAVSRTAYDDDAGGARNFHDANFLTFHRIKNFRTLRTPMNGK